MNNDHVQYRPKSRYYIPPLLLGHDYLKWILLASIPVIAAIFFAGYILGFEKSNSKWMSNLEPIEIALPDAGSLALAEVAPQPPEKEEPGASIDVDAADEKDSYVVVEAALESEQKDSPDEAKVVVPAEEFKLEEINSEVLSDEENNTEQDDNIEIEKDGSDDASTSVNLSASTETSRSLLDIISGLVVPDQNESEIEVISEQDSEALAQLNDANEETAQYSIQVGMYSDYDDADEKVSQLLKANLHAYLEDYTTQKDEARYNVRFGYFKSFKSGQKALQVYKNIFGGFGYVARINR